MQPAHPDTPVATSGNGWFYIHQDGQTRDAVTLAEIKQEILGGKLRADSLACEAGETEWQTVSAHALLASELAPLFARTRRLAELQSTLEAVGASVSRGLDRASNLLSATQVFYRSATDIIDNPSAGPVFFEKTAETLGPTTLWVVYELIDAGTLPVYTQACIKGTDFWRDALQICRSILGKELDVFSAFKS
jgi:hypothetical protein